MVEIMHGIFSLAGCDVDETHVEVPEVFLVWRIAECRGHFHGVIVADNVQEWLLKDGQGEVSAQVLFYGFCVISACSLVFQFYGHDDKAVCQQGDVKGFPLCAFSEMVLAHCCETVLLKKGLLFFVARSGGLKIEQVKMDIVDCDSAFQDLKESVFFQFLSESLGKAGFPLGPELVLECEEFFLLGGLQEFFQVREVEAEVFVDTEFTVFVQAVFSFYFQLVAEVFLKCFFVVFGQFFLWHVSPSLSEIFVHSPILIILLAF